MNDDLFVLIDRVGLVEHRIAVLGMPAVDVDGILYHCNRHAIMDEDTVALVMRANDNAVVARCSDHRTNRLAGSGQCERRYSKD